MDWIEGKLQPVTAFARHRFGWSLLFVCVALGTVPPVYAQEGPQEEEPVNAAETEKKPATARLLRLKLPITGSADAVFTGAVRRALEQLELEGAKQEERRPTLVIEFDPEANAKNFGLGSEFERAFAIARFLTSDELAGVRTVAYLPRTIKGHAVLVAMACEEIVMNPQAEFGEAGLDEKKGQRIEPAVRTAYEQIAQARRTVPVAIAVGMVDDQAEVLQVETEENMEFVLRADLEKLRKERAIVSEQLLGPRGSRTLLSGRQGRELGIVKSLATDSQSLARALDLPVTALVEDQSLLSDWQSMMVDISGPIDNRLAKRVQTLIGRELDQRDVNWIGLRIDSAGGELAGFAPARERDRGTARRSDPHRGLHSGGGL